MSGCEAYTYDPCVWSRFFRLRYDIKKNFSTVTASSVHHAHHANGASVSGCEARHFAGRTQDCKFGFPRTVFTRSSCNGASVQIGFFRTVSHAPHEMERKCLDAKANISVVEYRMHIRFLSHCIDTLILRRRRK